MNLLTNSDGKKFGKSEKGAIFLDPNLTSPYSMYQFLINQSDDDVIRLLKFLTLLNKEEIQEIENIHFQAPFKRYAQNMLAKWIVVDIHGEQTYNRVKEISSILFNGDIKQLNINELKMTFENVPSTSIDCDEMNIVDFLIASKIVNSKREARELITNNSIIINGDKINDLSFIVKKSDAFNNEFTIIKKGKKNYFLTNWL